jgi:hypothetical protein
LWDFILWDPWSNLHDPKEQMGHGINNIIYQLSSSLNMAKKTDFYLENIRFKPKGFTLFVNFKGSIV